jgi:hypothetical protein
MQKLLILILTLGMAANSFAVVRTPVHRKPVPHRQESQKTKVRIGWYVAPALKIGEIRSEIRLMIGIRGGLEVNRRFYVGVAGYGLVKTESRGPVAHSCYGYDDDYDYHDKWDLGYGGLEFGIIAGNPQTGQLSLGALVGGGATNEHRFDYYNTGYTGNNHSDYHSDHYHKHGFFVFEPQLDLSASVARNVRISVGGSYRFVGHLKSIHYTQEDLQGPTFNIGVAVGVF